MWQGDSTLCGGTRLSPDGERLVEHARRMLQVEAAALHDLKAHGLSGRLVFGIPDEDWGEHVKAVVEPAAGIEPSQALAEEILAFCKERLASFKIPRSIDFTAALPRDPNGKLYKRKLRDPYWEGRDRAI